MRNFLASIIGTIGTTAFTALAFGMAPGWLFWIWMSIQLGSFMMFLFAFLGPFGLIAAFLGLWSLIFGAPVWLLHLVA